jgi:chemotaxis protein methyltransferase CheR
VGLSVGCDIRGSEAVRQWVWERTGIVLGGNPDSFARRLLRIQQRFGWERLEDLAAALDEPAEDALRDELIDAATTQETSWFRDPALFDALRSLVLSHGDRSMSIWSAGCAYGQEIYSVAMVLAEAGALSRVRLLATDISPNALRRAAEGRYLSLEMARGLSERRREQYFHRDASNWTLNADIRGAVEFRRHDLRQSLGERFDIILCRHVLIYFDPGAQRLTLHRLAGSLNHGGYLALGNAESLRRLDAPFRKCSIFGAAFYCPLPSMYE